MIFGVCSALKARASLIALIPLSRKVLLLQRAQAIGLEVIHYYFNTNLNRILNKKLLPNSESYLSKVSVPATHHS